ncbi:hypothetical protein BGZ76_010317 [Entomortierella beljakovae]|nr:hypothetical protein BGZ76_010317 [Entomortierella beljakovae]
MGKPDKYYYNAQDDDNLEVDPHDLTYSLEIVQQPIRARMCGFGDKDRRNVTPAPVLRLVAKTSDGRTLSASQLSKQTFVVTADLWLDDEITERNLVLISSIPSSRTAAYSLQQAALTHESQQDQLGIQENTEETDSYPSSASSPATAAPSNASRMSIRNVIHDDDISTSSVNHNMETEETNGSPGQYADLDDEQEYHRDNDMYVEQDLRELREMDLILRESPTAAAQARKEMSTRNLVGQIAVSGQIAPGVDDDLSHIWFAFSILSIRTEGFFKIRFSLADLTQIPENGKSRTICQVFSNTIHVQTPKKFEGTCDNNKTAVHLNKNCIRIPARKDEKKINKNRKDSLP